MNEMPLGLLSALSGNKQVQEAFVSLPYDKQRMIIEKAKNAQSRNEMRQIVSEIEKY